MITKDRENRHFGVSHYDCQCDKCSHYESIEAENFNDVIQQLKDLGWKIYKYEVWMHECPAHDKPKPETTQVQHDGW